MCSLRAERATASARPRYCRNRAWNRRRAGTWRGRFDGQQIANGVGVFGAIQAVQAGRRHLSDPVPVELILQPYRHGFVRSGIRPRHARLRHHAGPQHAHHFLPLLGVLFDVLRSSLSSSRPAGAPLPWWQVMQYSSSSAYSASAELIVVFAFACAAPLPALGVCPESASTAARIEIPLTTSLFFMESLPSVQKPSHPLSRRQVYTNVTVS